MGRNYSRRTVTAATFVLSALNQSEFTSFIVQQRRGLIQNIGQEGTGNSLQTRLNKLVLLVDSDPGIVTDDGRPLTNAIVEKAVEVLHANEIRSQSTWAPANPRTEDVVFRRALEAEGLQPIDGELRTILPVSIPLAEPESELGQLLRHFQLEDARNHLRQALENHARGNWEAANSQLRTFVEAIFQAVVDIVAPGHGLQKKDGEPIRRKLLTAGFLHADLNEWDFIVGFVKRLHGKGSHPGRSDEEDCTYRLHLVLLTVHHLLRRLLAGMSGP